MLLSGESSEEFSLVIASKYNGVWSLAGIRLFVDIILAGAIIGVIGSATFAVFVVGFAGEGFDFGISTEDIALYGVGVLGEGA